MRTHLPGRIAIAAAAATPFSGAAARAASTPVVVKTARTAKLHRTVLVNRPGRTLDSLGAERHGRFVCTDSACLGLWAPLTLRRGTHPRGTVGPLSTVRRPDGRTRVAYRGRPLDTFDLDRAKNANGEGFKDVGTWHAVAPSRR